MRCCSPQANQVKRAKATSICASVLHEGNICAKCNIRSTSTENRETLFWLLRQYCVLQARIDELAARLALPPAQFADNLESDFMVKDVQNQASFPIEQAEAYVSEVCLA